MHISLENIEKNRLMLTKVCTYKDKHPVIDFKLKWLFDIILMLVMKFSKPKT